MKSRFWGYRTGERGRNQFVMLANSGGSSSCRLFDAASGALISLNTSRGAGSYHVVYGAILRDCKELDPPPGIKTSELTAGLPPHHLSELQAQLGIVASPMPAVSAVPLAPNVVRQGMLSGISGFIDDALGLGIAFHTRSAALQLSQSPVPLDAAALFERSYDRILRNWDRSECRSTQLWRDTAQSFIATHNTSPEKTLEKAIVEWTPGWFNQIPAASGLIVGVEERHCNVDLGHFIAPGHLELVELKAGLNADTPVKAAFEIAGYGLLYCFARAHHNHLRLPAGNRLLNARRVDLKVLAPREVYAEYRLKWLETSLNDGLQQFTGRRFSGAWEMNFHFESFAADFAWPGIEHYKLPGFMQSRAATWL